MFTITELTNAAGGRVIASGFGANVRSVSTDSRTIGPDEAFCAIRGENFDGHDFILQAVRRGAGCVIAENGRCIDAGTGVTVIEVPDTVKAYGAIARFHRRRFNIPVIGITGSNGKTTTKDMLARILSAKYATLKSEGTRNNHIGVPATLLQLGPSHTCAVIEFGTNHPGEIAYLSGICEPTMALITNVGPSHLEYFRDLAGVYREKADILGSSPGLRAAFLNADDRMLRKRLARRTSMPLCIGFGISNPCDFRARDVKNDARGFCFSMHRSASIRLSTPGECNVYNALAAVAVSRVLGMSYPVIAARLKDFVFPRGRLTMRTVEDVRFIDDSYNANPRSMAQALDALRRSAVEGGRRVLVMGDMLELGPGTERFHRDAGRRAAGSCDVFIAVGRHSALAANAALSRGFERVNVFSCETPAQARDILYKTVAVRKNDVVLVKGSRGMKLEQIIEP
ncbi:MAG TPA: UDP-N-acetylmuramoyl-tripeptide--D-alanyl-D-alanine ligase [Candidatus Omnitrophota bacterium]|nr:UDP-N-acetylmuramoyl-tripeptide--D-alanyl-D-alanine ligase [Candidatus Omnitrophota bacterium]HQO38683.1 UDP-N-acetylmuramoyl-tripeptide--D-alanyl-D-alanine ligase [Candidatus Omnitrophota bacterium]HQQ06178.1 UDP-N-acetylmuramoyl-tripeptide--D-alanyl-D-alanine ligase [Candidatus Omnitrophota bacterium]